jgi:high-affinity iron transporter
MALHNYVRGYFMAAIFLITLREGLEAALIIGVLLGALKKTGRLNFRATVWSGAALAFALSVIIGLGLNLLGTSFDGRAEEIFEGIAMLLAAVFLTWAILWMQSQSRAINNKLDSDVQQAAIKGSKAAIFSLAFLAVIREGIELAFFLTAASIDTTASEVLVGAALGLASVAILSILLFKSLVRLDVAKFFKVTSVILILFAAGLVAHGVHEFNEAGIIPSVVEHVWDMNHILDEKSTIGELLKTLIGYNGNPSLTEVIAYILYYVILWMTGVALKKREQRLTPSTV